MIETDRLLAFAETLIYAKTTKNLNFIQTVVLRESLQQNKNPYEIIAKKYGYSPSYIKQIAPQLWRTISDILGEKITKTNARAILEKKIINQNYSRNDRLIETLRKKLNKPPNTNIIFDTEKELEAETIQETYLSTKVEISEKKLEVKEIKDDFIPLTSESPRQISEEIINFSSSFYIQRSSLETMCFEEIIKPGGFLQILAPKKMGKTSLMMKILESASLNEYKTAILNFQELDKNFLGDLNKLLRWLCANLSLQLNLTSKVNNYWNEDLGDKTSCTLYLEKYILPSLQQPLILSIDKFNKLICFPEVKQEFIELLNLWNEKAKRNSVWEKLRISIASSHRLLNCSSGLCIEILPFSLKETESLALAYYLELNSEKLELLFKLTGGFPYLLELAFSYLKEKKNNFEELIKTSATDRGIFKYHLQEQLDALIEEPHLLTAYQQLIQDTERIKINPNIADCLYALGLIQKKQKEIKISCELYQIYFEEIFCLPVL